MDNFVVPSDPSSPSHQKTLDPQVEVGEVDNPPVDLSPSPPTPPTQDSYADLDCNSDGYHVVLSSHPSFIGPFDTSDFGVVFSFISNLTCDVHEDQVLDGVGVELEPCDIIFNEYVWESEQESMVKDGLFLSAPHLL